MDGSLTSHRILNPPSLPAPVGFSHVVVAVPGRTVYIAGQAGHLPDGSIPDDSIVRQFEVAAGNVVKALTAAGGLPEHVVAMQILTTDAAEYRASLEGIGAAYRHHFGRHYPAITFLEVKGLFDPAAKIELTCVAVIPED